MRLYVDLRIGGCPRYFMASKPPRLPMVPERIRSCVLYVCHLQSGSPPDAEPVPGGTAFFVQYDEEGLGFLYLVTARHNIEYAEQNDSGGGLVRLRANLRGGGYNFIETAPEDWIPHPDERVDVAVFDFGTDIDNYEIRGFPIKGIFNDKVQLDQQIGPGDQILIAGLFTKRSGKQRNLPLIRMGTIAAMPEEPFWTNWPEPGLTDAYIIEVRSISGLSGSPVFVIPQGISREWVQEVAGIHISVAGSPKPIYLLGLVQGHFEAEPDSRSMDGNISPKDSRINAGLAIVVPGSKILDILNSPKLVTERRSAIAKRNRRDINTVPD